MITRRFIAMAAALLTLSGAYAKRQLFNDGWEFRLGDCEVGSVKSAKGWQKVRLPHDWSIHEPFSETNSSGNDGGYLPTGIGWYRKTFTISDKAEGGISKLYFEGVYMNSTVYVNGDSVGGHPYGFSSFFCDISKAIRKGENTITVRVDNSRQKNCRWYTGSGIYRNVWLITKPSVGIEDWGVAITTPTENEVNIRVSLYNSTTRATAPTVRVDVGGNAVESLPTRLEANTSKTVELSLNISDPILWSIDNPHLFNAEITVADGNGSTLDRQSQKFGIRAISYDATHGLMLNGKPLKLNGGCLHHDNGILGAEAWDDAEVRKVALMKQAGFNAARTSHNPPSEAFLNACDSMGMLVIDEAFDGWRTAKNQYDYSTLFDQWYKSDIEAMVRRDRNHPSIVCWSVGNEIMERKSHEAVATAFQLREQVKLWDNSRPITSALAAWDKDWEIYDPLASAQDIVGYNYMIQKAESDHERVPQRVMWQTESYPHDAYKNWKRCQQHPYIVGDFVWTAIDYIGESGIGRYWYDGDPAGEHYQRPLWPWHAAYCGDIDLTGHLKPIGHYRSLLWNPEQNEQTYMAVSEPDGYYGKINTGHWATWPTVESWNWPEWEGKDIDVVVCSRSPEVSLYLNGQLVGTKQVADSTEYKAVFRLPYKPGTLKAVAGNQELTLTTAGKPARIALKADRSAAKAGGLCFVDVWICDKRGNVCPNANSELTVETAGGGELLALGNADIKAPSPYYDNTHRTWHGHALAVVLCKGKTRLTVKAKGLGTASIDIATKR